MNVRELISILSEQPNLDIPVVIATQFDTGDLKEVTLERMDPDDLDAGEEPTFLALSTFLSSDLE